MTNPEELYRRHSKSFDKLHASEKDDELVEKMALAMLALSQKRAVETGHDIHLILSDVDRDAARAALTAARPVIRVEVLEEAAKVCADACPECAAAIRALILSPPA